MKVAVGLPFNRLDGLPFKLGWVSPQKWPLHIHSFSLLLSLISFLIRDGRIAAIDYDDKVAAVYAEQQFEQVIDAAGKTVVPGLVDAHTHPVWAGDRVHEFSMKVSPTRKLSIVSISHTQINYKLYRFVSKIDSTGLIDSNIRVVMKL